MEISIIAGQSTSRELLFHFSSGFIALSMQGYESNISPPAPCALLVKDEILASNPPVSTQDAGVAACFLFVLAYIGICPSALLQVKV